MLILTKTILKLKQKSMKKWPNGLKQLEKTYSTSAIGGLMNREATFLESRKIHALSMPLIII